MALLCVGFAGCISTPLRSINAGPLYTAEHDLKGTPVVRALGPLFERQQSADGKTFTAVRPFWSKVTDPEKDRSVSDVVWPLGMIKTRQGESDWRFFPAFGHDFDSESSRTRSRWSIFPILFGGRSLQNEAYFAVFPLGGTVREFLGRDMISFVLFPLYVYSEMDNTKSLSVLWPIYSRTKGPGVDRFRVWPFYGISTTFNRWTKRFVMWPFWTSVQYEYPDQKGGGFVLFPFYGRVNVGQRHSRMLLPPLFKREWADDGSHSALNAPWPFFQYSRGATDKLYVWPFFGRKAVENERQWFSVWPFVSGRRTDFPTQTVRRFQAIPLVYYESKHERLPADSEGVRAEREEAVARYFKLWPLIAYRREADYSLFRTLALWPLKQTPAVERNWAPLWSLYTRERAGKAFYSEFLWGLYRHRRSESSRQLSVFPLLQTAGNTARQATSWSLLYGLAGYEREGLHKTYRLLYFLKFGRDSVSPAITNEGNLQERDPATGAGGL